MAEVDPDPAILEAALAVIQNGMQAVDHRPFVLGLCGAQGSGKSTLAAALARACQERGLATAVLSIDDLYLTKAERLALAQHVHPLLATRGPPGTHDIALGLEVMAALRAGEAVALPRFDKGRDDRWSVSGWPAAPKHCEVLIFEGWCIGARPQSEAALVQPVNRLEADEDRNGEWRRYCNAALAGPYHQLFAAIDRLVLIAAPSFEVVHAWRWQQEQALIAQCGEGHATMDEEGVARFIRFYERLTRHILSEMPARADLTVRIDEARRPISFAQGTGG